MSVTVLISADLVAGVAVGVVRVVGAVRVVGVVGVAEVGS